MTTQTDVPTAAPTAATRWSAGRWVVPVACGLIAAQLAYRAWASFGSYWEGDDLGFIERVFAPGGTSLGDLLQPFAGHVMAAGFYLTWLINRAAPYDWTVAACCLTLMQALASLGLLRLLLTAFGRRWGIVPPLVLYLTTAYTVQSAVWWATAIQALPLQISFFWAMSCQVSYLRTRRRSSAVAAMAWVVFGLAFYEKSLLTIGALAIVSIAWFTRGSMTERLRQVWQRYRVSVLGNLVLGVSYLVLYVHGGLNFGPDQAVTVPIGPTADILVLRSWGAAAVGGPVSWRHLSGAPISFAQPPAPLVVAAWTVLGLFVWQSARSRTRSLRALSLPAFYLGCDLLLVVAGRSSVVGPVAGTEYRYLSELSAVNAVAVAFALMPARDAVEPVEVRQPSPWLDRPRPVLLTCLVVAALGLWSTTAYTATWHRDLRSKGYLPHLIADSSHARPGTPVINRPVPDYLRWAFPYPDNTMSHLLVAEKLPVRYVEAATDRVLVPDAEGHLRPADVTRIRSGLVGAGTACVGKTGAGTRTIGLDGPLIPGLWWVKVGYIATGDSAITVEAGGRTQHTSVRPGMHTLYVAAGDRAFDSIRLGGLIGGVHLCTNDVTVGQPVPREAP